MTGYKAKLNLTDFPKVQDAHMGWNLPGFRGITDTYTGNTIELADPATVQEKRPGLQQLLTACEATWEEIMDKYGNRHRHA